MIQDRTSSWPSTTIGEVVDVVRFNSDSIELDTACRATRAVFRFYDQHASGVEEVRLRWTTSCSTESPACIVTTRATEKIGKQPKTSRCIRRAIARGKFWVNKDHAHIIKGKPGTSLMIAS